MRPRVLVVWGLGLHCEQEMRQAWLRAGAEVRLAHVLELLAEPGLLDGCGAFVLPGGFSYGDRRGAGVELAERLARAGVGERLARFVEAGGLGLGVCNGFQVLTRLGLLPGRLEPNEPAGYQCRWLELVAGGECVWTRGLGRLRLPVAHAEGRFEVAGPLPEARVALRYAEGWNPNGAAGGVAGVCDETGRLLGLMPHPERAIDLYQTEGWPAELEACRRAGREPPVSAAGLRLFEAAVRVLC